MDADLYLGAADLVNALLVVKSISLLLQPSLEPWLRVAAFELDGILYIVSNFTVSELLSTGKEVLLPSPVAAWVVPAAALYLHCSVVYEYFSAP